MEGPLLKDLCLICHANPSRYRCPRCAVRTCSLPCSRRHKLWSQCSGVRDPAEYVRRADLATPAGIDRDFNFLVGIERHLDRVERELDDRGIRVSAPPHGPGRGRQPLQKGEVNITGALERGRVVVEKAPTDLQRRRENQTRWNKKRKCLSWTVEWIDGQGRRVLSSAFETSDLQSAYASVAEDGSRPNKRRKRSSNADEPSPPAALNDEGPGSPPTPAPLPPTRCFYLVRPRTASASRVLIPMSPHSSLADCLRQRVVLEFPTFYVLSEPPDALPKGFITEDEYLASRGESHSTVAPPPPLVLPATTNDVDHDHQDPRSITTSPPQQQSPPPDGSGSPDINDVLHTRIEDEPGLAEIYLQGGDEHTM